MTDASRERAERRAGRVAQTEPAGSGNRRRLVKAAAAAATDPVARE